MKKTIILSLLMLIGIISFGQKKKVAEFGQSTMQSLLMQMDSNRITLARFDELQLQKLYILMEVAKEKIDRTDLNLTLRDACRNYADTLQNTINVIMGRWHPQDTTANSKKDSVIQKPKMINDPSKVKPQQ